MFNLKENVPEFRVGTKTLNQRSNIKIILYQSINIMIGETTNHGLIILH